MSRDRKYILLSAAVIASAFLFHLFTLTLYPIPWFDETLFASVSKSFLEQGNFFPTVAPFAFEFKDCLTYGPLFFIAQKISFLIFGFGSFAARIVVIFFGGTMLYMLLKIFNLKKNIPPQFLLLLSVGFLFDYTIFDGFHFGRMETMSMTFIFGYTFFILKNENEISSGKRFTRTALYSLCAALAVLTTPRSAVLLIPPGIILVYRFFQEKYKREIFIELFLLTVIFSAAIFFWIYYAFGGINEMLAYYKIVNQTADFWRGFSFSQSIYIYQYPVILTSFFLLGISVIVNGKKAFDVVNIISISTVVLFYALVTIYRSYGVYTIPYFYLIAVNCFYQIISSNPKKIFSVFAKLAVASHLIFVVGISILKMYYIIESKPEREATAINNFVKKNIPPHSKVIGDEVYYYSVLKSGSDYQYMHWYDTDENREKYQREVYDYDYVLISDGLMKFNPNILKLYSSKSELQLVADFEPPLSSLTNYINKRQPSLVSFFTYNGHLYKRTKKIPY